MSVMSSTLSGAASGAASGFAMGAMVGSMIPIPVVSTAVGGMFGGALGGIVGGVNSYITSSGEESDAAKAREEMEKRKQEQRELYSEQLTSSSRYKQARQAANQYTTGLYANGSNGAPDVDARDLDLKGNLQQTSSTGAKIIGAPHSQGGVSTLDEFGNPIELEGNEFIDGEGDSKRVYSARLTGSDGLTFAKKAENISKEKAALEDKSLKTDDPSMQDTIDRQIEIIETRLARTFHEQSVASINN